MPICILGMHRSGTSPITRMLNLSGVSLGPEDQIMLPDAEDNPEGYWENQLIVNFNDELLAALDATWHAPPDISPGWSTAARFEPFRHRVRGLMADLADSEPWGWKDPRNSLTLEFWLSVYPDLKLVLCLRNPLEVARSLCTGKPMRTLTYEEALDLWAAYHERIVMSVNPDRLIVTHYDSYFYDAPAELRRVTDLLGISPSPEDLTRAIASFKRDARRNSIPRKATAQPGVPERVAQHYRALCLQAGPVFQAMESDAPYQLRIAEVALSAQFVHLQRATAELASANETARLQQADLEALGAAIHDKDAELAAINADRETLTRSLEQQGTQIVELNAHLANAQQALEQKDAELAAINADRETLTRSLEQQGTQIVELNAHLANAQQALEQKDAELAAIDDQLRQVLRDPNWQDADSSDDGEHTDDLVDDPPDWEWSLDDSDDAASKDPDDTNATSADIASLVQQVQARADYIAMLEADRANKQQQLDVVTREYEAISRSLAVRVVAKNLWRLRRNVAPYGSKRYALLRMGKRVLRRVLGRTPPQQWGKASRRPKSSTAYSVSSAPVNLDPREAVATVLCTIVSKNYISQARTLMRSVAEKHPDIHLVAILVDEIDSYFDPTAEPFETVRAAELGIPNWRHFAFKYSIMELNTAVKPYMLEYLFERFGARKVIYFDPDIIVYGQLDELLGLLDQYTVVLTPHLLDPLNDTFRLSELDILRAGTYNLGFVALSRSGQWRELLRWWQDKLYCGCIVDFEQGYFVDQRWMDLVPGLFQRAYVLRDPGYNVAYWNFKTRDLQMIDGSYAVDGQPLVFFHFSGFSVADPARVSKHQNRFVMKDLNKTYRACFEDYRQRLLANGYAETKDWPYAYGIFPDGAPVSDLARRCLLQHDAAGERWADPFDIASSDGFRHWLTQPSADPPARFVSPYVLAIHAGRPDLRAAFPYPTTVNDEALARWFVSREQEPEGEPITYHRAYVDPVKAALGLSTAPLAPAASAPAQTADQPTQAKAFPATSHPRMPRGPLPAGVNVIGYVRSETGVGQQARNMIAALQAADIPFAVQPIEINDRSRKQDSIGGAFQRGTPYAVNLFLVNADQTLEVRESLGATAYDGHYNIGYWHWELSTMPPQWEHSAAVYDELWTSSTFIQSAIAALTTRPASALPPAIEQPQVPGIGRSAFGLADDAFVALFAFDAFSIIERKNPWSLIEAYERAFSPAERRTRARLVIKVSNLEHFPRERTRLRAELRRVNGVLIDSYLDRVQVNALINACDVYVSLHRSEGYGLSLAEAMYFGKPTIATAYSGNVDFMLPDNSYLVPFSLVKLARDYPPYQAGNVWADPDVTAAAQMLRHTFEQRDEARERGARAAAYIREHNSPAAVGRTLSLALNQFWMARSDAQHRSGQTRRPLIRQSERPAALVGVGASRNVR